MYGGIGIGYRWFYCIFKIKDYCVLEFNDYFYQKKKIIIKVKLIKQEL